MLVAEAAQSLGIAGFAGQVFTAAGSSITKQLFTNITSELNSSTSLSSGSWLTDGFNTANLITSFFSTTGKRILRRDGFLPPQVDKKDNKTFGELVSDFFLQLKGFSLELWCLVILNFTFFSLLAFIAFATVFFSTKYG